jgi:hypothetical protein
MTSFMQTSLSGGELNPALIGMVDLAFYKNSLKTQRNYVTKPYGGIVNRSGSRYIAETKADGAAKVVAFSFNTTQSYAIEFGVGYLRIYANGVQQTYVWPGPAAWLTATNYSIGDYVQQASVYYYCLAAHTSGVFATDLAAGDWYALTMSVPGSTGILELPTPYTALELGSLKFTQSADVMTVCHPNHPPMQLSRFSDVKWTFQPQALNSGPFQQINIDKTVSVWASANVGTVTLHASSPLFYATQIGQLFYLEQKDLGQAWEPGKAAAINDVRRANGKYYSALTTGTTGQNIPAGTDDRWNDGGVDWSYLHSGFGVAQVTAIADTKTCTALVKSRLPDGTTTSGYGASTNITATAADSTGYTKGTAVAHGLALGFYGTSLVTITLLGVTVTQSMDIKVLDANTILFYIVYGGGVFGLSGNIINSFLAPISSNASASYKWAWGAFGNPAIGGPGYPSAVTYYQQRLCFAGTPNQPDTVWMSRTNSYSDFSTSGPLNIQDDDSVTFTVAGSQVNAIKSMLQLNKLILLTSGAVWATGTGQNTDALTPSNISIRMQGYRGVSDLPPIGIGQAALYVQAKGKIVHDLTYQFYTDNYTGDDLTAKAAHLTDGYTLVDWAYQECPLDCVWAVRNDGTLIGLTYLKEQQVAAWHHHDTQGTYESVCAVSEGNEDVLYTVVKRTMNGVVKRFIERFDTRLITDISDAFFVDCGTTFDGRYMPGKTSLWDCAVTLSGGTVWDATDELTLTMGASTGVPFTGISDIGDQVVILGSDGQNIYVTITAYTDGSHAKGRPDRTVPVADRAVPKTGWAWARDTVTGLTWLANMPVSILADGGVQAGGSQPSQTVSLTGTVTLNPPAVRAQIGLGYDSDFQPLPLVSAQQQIRDRMKNVHTVRIIVSETRGLSMGSDFDHLTYESTLDAQASYGLPPNLYTGVVEQRINSTWDREGLFASRHSDPTPIGILAIMPEVAIGGL